MKTLRFTRAFRAYRAGQVATVSGGLAAELIARRVAVEDTQQPLIETAAIEHQAETADATPRKRGRRSAVPKPDTPDAAGR